MIRVEVLTGNYTHRENVSLEELSDVIADSDNLL
jgi:hypothetical protein